MEDVGEPSKLEIKRALEHLTTAAHDANKLFKDLCGRLEAVMHPVEESELKADSLISEYTCQLAREIATVADSVGYFSNSVRDVISRLEI